MKLSMFEAVFVFCLFHSMELRQSGLDLNQEANEAAHYFEEGLKDRIVLFRL